MNKSINEAITSITHRKTINEAIKSLLLSRDEHNTKST
jgi:hypothetical protein